MELPKEKRPPDDIIWDGSPEDMEDWLDRIFGNKEKMTTDIVLTDKNIES